MATIDRLLLYTVTTVDRLLLYAVATIDRWLLYAVATIDRWLPYAVADICIFHCSLFSCSLVCRKMAGLFPTGLTMASSTLDC